MTQLRPGPKPKTRRNARILALRGTMSIRMLAAKLGITPGAISGVCFRADYPLLRRYQASGRANMIGTGHKGPGRYARSTIHRPSNGVPR